MIIINLLSRNLFWEEELRAVGIMKKRGAVLFQRCRTLILPSNYLENSGQRSVNQQYYQADTLNLAQRFINTTSRKWSKKSAQCRAAL